MLVDSTEITGLKVLEIRYSCMRDCVDGLPVLLSVHNLDDCLQKVFSDIMKQSFNPSRAFVQTKHHVTF